MPFLNEDYKPDTPDQVIEKLWRWGHIRQPLERAEREAMTLTCPAIQEALFSYQDHFKGLLDAYSREKHGRAAKTDGSYGPATAALMAQPRCDCPDFQLPNESAAMEVAFPESCRQEITRFEYMSRQGSGGIKGQTPDRVKEAFQLSGDIIEESVKIKFRVDESLFSRANQYVYAAPLGENVLGDQYLSRGSCNDRLRGRMSNAFDYSNYSLLVAVLVHELMHAIGVGHVNDVNATQNPYITRQVISRQGRLHEVDIQLLENIGYERIQNLDEPDVPDCPECPECPPVPSVKDVLVNAGVTVHTGGIISLDSEKLKEAWGS